MAAIRCPAVVGLVLCGALAPGIAQVISDTTPPRLVGLSFGPNPVNVTAGPATLTVDFTVTDDLAGVGPVWASFRSPSGLQTISFPFTSTMIAGTPLSGIWRGTVQMPQFSELGVWKIEVYLWDFAGNSLTLPPQALAALGLPTDLTVVSTPDRQPPAVTGISISPSAIDVSQAAQTITIDLTLTDNQSGLQFTNLFPVAGNSTVGVISPTNRQSQYVLNYEMTPLSGNPRNGIWRARIPIPRYSEPGNWKIGSLLLFDNANNSVFLFTTQLEAMGLPVTFTVTSIQPDTTPPRLTGFSYTPMTFDTSTADQTVHVYFQISDDRAGIGYVNSVAPLCVEFQSPSGAQRRSTCTGFADNELVAGTRVAGVWQANLFFPRYSEAGTWRVSNMSMFDTTHNQVWLDTSGFAALGFSATIEVIQPTDDPDGSVGPAGGTIIDEIFPNRARVTFPPGVLPGMTEVAISVLTSPLAIPTPAGFSAGSYFTNIGLKPSPPMPFPAPGITLVLPLSQFRAPGSSLQLFRLDPITGTLVPAARIGGGFVVGTVNADGLSATFTGVARLSTVVAFAPNTVFGDVNGDQRIDCNDVAIVRASFGKRSGQAGFDARADINRDGVVNVIDLTIVTRQLPPAVTCP